MSRTIWYFRKRLIALKALITQDSIGLTEELEQVEKSQTKSQTKSCEKTVRVSQSSN